MSRAVIDVVSRSNDPVWFTEFGYVSIRDGLLASAATDAQQKEHVEKLKFESST